MFEMLKGLYYHFSNANKHRKDSPEAKEIANNIMALYQKHIIEHESFDEKEGKEKLNELLTVFSVTNELQGFIYGFGYAVRIMAECMTKLERHKD